MEATRNLTEAERKQADQTLEWLKNAKEGEGLAMDPEQSEVLTLRRIELGQYLGPEETAETAWGSTITFRRWFNADGTPTEDEQVSGSNGCFRWFTEAV